MKKLADLFPKVFRSGLMTAYFGFGVVEYLAYYQGLLDLIGGGFALFAIGLTVILRLDILAASLGFWGEWKIWHWPMWLSLMITIMFESLSLAINYGPGYKPPTFLQRMWPSKKSPK